MALPISVWLASSRRTVASRSGRSRWTVALLTMNRRVHVMWSSQSLRIAARNDSGDTTAGVTTDVPDGGLAAGLASCATTGSAVVATIAVSMREAAVEVRSLVMTSVLPIRVVQTARLSSLTNFRA